MVSSTPPRPRRLLPPILVLVWLAAAAWSGAGAAGPAAVGYAPVDLEIVDVDATVAIASKAGELVPIVLIQDPAVVEIVAGGFEAAFLQTHDRFLDGMESIFGARVIDAAVQGTREFRDFRAGFQEDNTLFPVSAALAQTWARGFDGGPVRDRIAGLLRAIQRDHLIGEIRPASSVFVVAPEAAGRVRSWGEIAPRARAADPSDVLDLPAAGELLRRMNDPLDRAAGGYLSGMIRPNVTEDRHLTGLLLRERLGAAVILRRIARGTKLTEAGQPVDTWAALALVQLGRLGLEPVDTALAAVPTEALSVGLDAGGAPATRGAGARAWVWWLGGGSFVAVGGLLAWLIFAARHRVAGTVAVLDPYQAPGDTGEAMIPHLARELRDRLVRALFTQRSVLLANEQAASRRVQEMEERLARLQPAIAEKIRSYEQRIEVLEKEIAERDVETRELLRAKLVLARQELDAEIARNRIFWN